LLINNSDIRKELQGKSGVYMFLNKINGNCYIGSSINLNRRFRAHMYLVPSSNLPLYCAIRKYGLENFLFLVLEYCEPNINTCIKLEQKYIDLYNPDYNILKIAKSSFGFKHSSETIAKLKLKHKGELHPRFGKSPSKEQKELTSIKIKEFYKTNVHPSKGKKGINSPQYGIGGKVVYCYNNNNENLYFPSINSARLHFKVRSTKISDNLNTNN
jgi:group I intron endonuclease